MRVAIYTRLSRDRTGEETATARQEADCRAYAQAKRWDVVEVYTDVDLSAYKRGVERPGYEAMLRAVGDRGVDAVLVWKLDRLVRRSAEFERFWDACERHGVALASVNDPVDTTTEIGVLIVRLLIGFAQMESATMSLRQRRKQEEMARDGLPRPSGTRPYGLTADWMSVVPHEAEIIVEGAERVIAGDSLHSIVRDWNARGIAPVSGDRWTATVLRHILRSPRTSGQREHRGVIVAKGVWPAILTPEKQARVLAVLNDPVRQPAPRQHQWLLSGLGRCGVCGRTLIGGAASAGARYICPAKPNGCQSVSIRSHILEPYVVDAFLARFVARRLDGHRPADGLDATLADQAAALQAELDALARDFGNGTIGRSEWVEARAPLSSRLDATRRTLAARQGGLVLATNLGDGDPGEAWERLTFERKRATMRAAIDRIVVRPVGRNRHAPLADRVAIEWRG